MIQKERIKSLNRKSIRKGATFHCWMRASQSAEYNHALEYSILKTNEFRQT